LVEVARCSASPSCHYEATTIFIKNHDHSLTQSPRSGNTFSLINQVDVAENNLIMTARGFHHDETPTSSEASTPNNHLSASWSVPTSVSHAVTGLLRRFSSDTPSSNNTHSSPATITSPTFSATKKGNAVDGVYTPPYRTASPFQPPPLYPIDLNGYKAGTPASARLLTRALAEEIRLLVPPRLQLCEEWNLVYSLEQDGVSLGTLYKKCDDLRGLRNGFVLIIKDGEGGVRSLLVPLPSHRY
jgi:hypothetical protein